MTAKHPDRLPGARHTNDPQRIEPQLATAVDQAPDGDQWLSEIKYEGYRGITVIADGSVRIYSRRGNEWTGRFKPIAAEIASAGWDGSVLDGEIVVFQPDGTTDFQALQNVLRGAQKGFLAYALFDLPFYRGYDLTRTPLKHRKALLKDLVSARRDWEYLRYCDHVVGSAAAFYREACRNGPEGILSKRAAAVYVQRRTRSWLKIKCRHRQEFVIGGYTASSSARRDLGALLLGYYDERNRLTYAGRVGTGFDRKTLQELQEKLRRRRRADSAFDPPPSGREARGVHWTRPDLVAEVAFGAWTRDDRLRQPVFKGLREDKPAETVVREATPGRAAMDAEGDGTAPSGPARDEHITVAGVTLSNARKILYEGQGIRKRDLAHFYRDTAEWILPHITERPVMLLRCPEGMGAGCFHQKHAARGIPEEIRRIPIAQKRRKRKHLYIKDLSGLIAAVQLGALEFHPWGCRVDRPDRPDRLIFDLDPGEGVDWQAVVEAARLVHDLLQEMALQSFVKSSGGKGLHVVVPLIRRNSWDELYAFSENVAHALAGHFPERYLATMRKSRRAGKVFIDYFRNSRGATTVAPYSTRARPGVPVSTPLAWSELQEGATPRPSTWSDCPGACRVYKTIPGPVFSMSVNP